MRTSPTANRIIKLPVSQRMIQTERAARVLRPAPRFLLAQLGSGTGRYSVPTGAVIHVRHRSRDIDMVNEIFGSTGGRLAYEPPADLAARLDAKGLRILDLGGNVGVFGAFALGRWQVEELVSFEPDPANAALLEATIASNPAVSCWKLRRAAVSNSQGVMRFVSGQFSESRRADPGEESIDVEMVDLFSLDHDVDLVKIDIEGGEWAILVDPRLPSLGARALVMEWHCRSCPASNAHTAVIELLTGAGYEIRLDIPSEDETIGVLWAARP
jgi:FkbM family methyltransferase